MIINLYIKRLKCLVRNKENMFWTYIFPLVMASCFFFAFSNLWTIESFETIKIAYVEEAGSGKELKEVIEQAVIEDKMMFSVTYCDSNEAAELLEDDKIEAYIIAGNNTEMFIRRNGLNETITKSFLDNYLRASETIMTVLADNPKAMEEGLLDDIMHMDSFVSEAADKSDPDPMLIYFFALLAFACLFSANWGLTEVINIQADQSLAGARVNVSPVNKMKLFLCNIAAAFTVHMVSILLLLFYLIFMLKIDFGDRPLLLILTCVMGSMAGIIVGGSVGVLVKAKASAKDAIITTIMIACGFLSGMMYADMKYIIATRAPFLAYINPVSLMADAFYSLYYYDNYDRYLRNLIALCIITVVLGALSYLGLRRKTYASI